MTWKTIRHPLTREIDEYLGSSDARLFDFETSGTEEYREEEFSALDAHKADITGLSFSVRAGTARYVPLRHRKGKNADPKEILDYLAERLSSISRSRRSHNLAFEAMFLYKYGIVIQEPVYDTIVAAQLTLKDDDQFRDLMTAA